MNALIADHGMPFDAARARSFYDRMGRWQDTQRFYEDAATARLTEAGEFAGAHTVFELGCGTGRFASALLADELPADARYLGVDISPVMVDLARGRLARWAPRADVRLLDPPGRVLPGTNASFDRFVATYVFDLLADSDAEALIDEAARVLAPGGRLALVSLTHGRTPASRLVSSGWGAIARHWPGLLGGCRPIELDHLLASGPWTVLVREVVISWGVPSGVLVATRTDHS